jgi:hypothetical protein
LDEATRATAYSDLLSALLALRADPATARFDAELAAAEAEGRVDGSVARTLRWWQRESLRGLVDHLGGVLPDLLTHLAESDRAAAETVAASLSSWTDATAALAATAMSAPAPPVAPASRSPFTPAPLDFPGASPTPPGPHLRPVDDARSAPTLSPAPPLRPGFAPLHPPTAPPTTPPRGSIAQVAAAPPTTDVATASGPLHRVDDVPPGNGAPRRRLLVAGLTVLTDGAVSTPGSDTAPEPRGDTGSDPEPPPQPAR